MSESGATMMKDVEEKDLNIVMVMLPLFSVLGFIGNFLVLLVYSRKREKLTANLFIRVLAMNDTVVCLLVIPWTAYIEYSQWKSLFPGFCSLYYFVMSTSIPFAALLVSAIALDRYLCICHPTSHYMTWSRAMRTCLALFLFSAFIGFLCSFHLHSAMRISTKWDAVINASVTSTRYECTELNYTADQGKEVAASGFAQQFLEILYSRAFFNLASRTQMILFYLCIIIVIVLYSKILLKVIQVRKRRIAWRSRATVSGSSRYQGTEMRLLDGTGDAIDSGPASHQQQQQQQKDNQILQNLKTAGMLFVVAVVYITTMFPSSLMALKAIQPTYLPIFYLYYLNNATNPLIYGFLNKNFRDDLQSLVCSSTSSTSSSSTNASHLSTRKTRQSTHTALS